VNWLSWYYDLNNKGAKRMIYFDNASTSFPKPTEVIDGVHNLITNASGNAMRTTSTEDTDIVFETRKKWQNC